MEETTEIEEAALNGIDGFFDKLTEAADVVTTKLIEVTPAAAETILNLIQFKGVFNISLGVFATLMATPFIYFAFNKMASKERERSGDGVFSIGCGLLLSCALLALLAGTTFSFYNWLSAFYPEGAIALKALQAVGIDL